MVGIAPGDSDDQRNSPYINRERKVVTNPRTGAVEVRHVEFYMTAEQVQAARDKVKRARASTVRSGIKAPRTAEEHRAYCLGK